jgi:hypothetical protein
MLRFGFARVRAAHAFRVIKAAVERAPALLPAVLLALAMSGTAFATDPITLPTIGVDVGGTATAVGTALGAIVQVALTLGGAFFVVRIGYRWVRSMVR